MTSPPQGTTASSSAAAPFAPVRSASRIPGARIRYHDPWLQRLFEDVVALVDGERSLLPAIEERIVELGWRNCSPLRDYWRQTETEMGVPTSAFRNAAALYYFNGECDPARIFHTSGTSGRGLGAVAYSRLGLALMDRSIVASARRHISPHGVEPAMIRLLPDSADLPHSVIAYGMEKIARTLGNKHVNESVVGPDGPNLARLAACLDAAVAEGMPVVLLGASFSLVNIFTELKARRLHWQAPIGSRVVDAGGFKGRSRELVVEELRALVSEVIGVDRARFTNLFGMTELASQLYDSVDEPVGPRGERPKGDEPYVEARVRDPETLARHHLGPGLLEVRDLCVIDRPAHILTGDLAVAAPSGVAVLRRIESGRRGCAGTLDALTTRALR